MRPPRRIEGFGAAAGQHCRSVRHPSQKQGDRDLWCHRGYCPIGATALVHEILVEPCDRVVSVQPACQQHDTSPESYGADVAGCCSSYVLCDEGYRCKDQGGSASIQSDLGELHGSFVLEAPLRETFGDARILITPCKGRHCPYRHEIFKAMHRAAEKQL